MKRTLYTLVCVLLFVLVLGLVNGISHRVLSRIKLDVSADRIYSVSDTTRKLLRGLDTPLQLKLFLSADAAKSSPPLVLAMEHVKNLLREYEREAAGKLKVEVLEVTPDSEEEIWADKYGLMPYRFGPTERIFFGLVGTNATGQEEIVPVFSPAAEGTLEYHLTKNVLSLSQSAKPRVAVISPLEIGGKMRRPTSMAIGQMPLTRAWVAVDELRKIAQVDFVDLDEPKIAPDVKLLIVIHPKQLSPLVTFAIDQFVMGGGKLILLEDPFCAVDLAGAESADLSMGLDRTSNLNDVTKAWGFEMHRAEVMADNNLATLVSTPTSGTLDDKFSLWLTFAAQNVGGEEVINHADPITAPIQELTFPWIGSFEIKEAEGVKVTPLVSTTSRASAVPDGVYRATGGSIDAVNKVYKSLGSPRTLAIRAKGTFKSAFSAPPQEVTLQTPDATPSLLQRSKQETEIVAIADVDFISDDFAVARQSVMGAPLASLVNNNIALLLSAVEELLGDSVYKLSRLRSKGKVFRPFERVQQLEAVAIETYQGEEVALMEKLRTTNAELEKLQKSTSDEDQNLILEKIQKFRQERGETQERLRELRFNLRRSKEELGGWLFGLNTFLVPLFLVLFSVLKVIRSRRT